MIKTFFAIALFFLAIVFAGGTEMRCTLFGRWSDKYSLSPATALFDGQLAYNAPHVIWDSTVAPKGCGLLLEFGAPEKLLRITVVTAKPNRLAWTQERTLFQAWDETKQEWGQEAVVPDVTGRAMDSSFVSAEPIETSWDANCETTAVRILMYGTGVWLTEVRVQGEKGEMLQALPTIEISEDATSLVPCGRAGGASANINFYDENQCYIGNPNVLNRKDRVLVNFDLRPFLMAGKVEQATLSLYLSPMGRLESNRLVLDAFTTPRTTLRSMDLIATDTRPVASFLFDCGIRPPWLLDVTVQVNEALKKGEGFLTFRLRNLTVEKVGNRKNQPEGAILDFAQTFLHIKKQSIP